MFTFYILFASVSAVGPGRAYFFLHNCLATSVKYTAQTTRYRVEHYPLPLAVLLDCWSCTCVHTRYLFRVKSILSSLSLCISVFSFNLSFSLLSCISIFLFNLSFFSFVIYFFVFPSNFPHAKFSLVMYLFLLFSFILTSSLLFYVFLCFSFNLSFSPSSSISLIVLI